MSAVRSVDRAELRDVTRHRHLRVVGDARELEMVALRESGLRFSEIARRYGVSRQRVAQIIDQAGRVHVEQVRDARRDAQLAKASERSKDILECYRSGMSVREIAHETGLTYEAVKVTLRERATDADRDARAGEHRSANPPAAFSRPELLGGLRAVGDELGRSPSLREYDQLSRRLGLASGQTVYMRFGGWNKALRAAGLEDSPATRLYSSRWHMAACWRALESVEDELGDPPSYRRYRELAAQRDDLPSAATLRVRLGPWSGIAALLVEQRARKSHRMADPVQPAATNGDQPVATPSSRDGTPSGAHDWKLERLTSLLGVKALKHLVEHPGSSGRAVQRGLGIRHDSQAWTLLNRLERDGLAERHPNGSSSGWALTPRGERVLRNLPEGVYA